MQTGLFNGHRYWRSSYGKFITYSTGKSNGKKWVIKIVDFEELGTPKASLCLRIKDPSKDCPDDNFQEKWMFGNSEHQWSFDVDHSVKVKCIKGKYLQSM